MILSRYLFRRFFSYLLLANVALTLLFNIIEFFEKLTRSPQAAWHNTLVFMYLNVLPSFLDLLPLSSWLAACLVIKELYQHHEWEALHIMSIGSKNLIRPFMIAGCIVVAISFIGKEFVLQPLTQKSEEYKMEHFKKSAHQRLYNRWYMLDDHIFVHMDYLDLASNKGSGLLVLQLDPTFHIKERLQAKGFVIDPSTYSITVTQGTSYVFATNTATQLEKHTETLPGLFHQLTMHSGVPSINQLVHNLIFAQNVLSTTLRNQELSILLKRLCTHLQPLIYVVLTLCLFILCPYHSAWKWLVILTVYPAFLVITTFTEFLAQHGTTAWVITAPYLAALLIMALCMVKLEE